MHPDVPSEAAALLRLPSATGTSYPKSSKNSYQNSFCGCCPDEQQSHSGPSLTAKTGLHLMDAMRETYGQTNGLYCFIDTLCSLVQ